MPRACARSAASCTPSRAATWPRAASAFTLDAARYLVIRCPTPWASTGRRPTRTLQGLLRERDYDLVVCDFLPPMVNLPERCPARSCSSRTTSRRRSGGGTPRPRPPGGGSAARAAVAAHAAFEGRRSARRPRARRVRRRPRHASSGCTGRSARRCTSCRPAWTPRTSRRAVDGASAAATSCSPARWTGCRTKTGCSSSPRGPAPHPAGGAEHDAVDRRARADTRRRRLAERTRHRGDRAAWTTCGRTSRPRRVHRAAADRRRHAAEDLRGDGHGQGRRVDHRGRRGAAGRFGPAPRSSPTSPGLRRRRRAPVPEPDGAARGSAMRPATWSSSSTTGRPSAGTSRRRSTARRTRRPRRVERSRPAVREPNCTRRSSREGIRVRSRLRRQRVGGVVRRRRAHGRRRGRQPRSRSRASTRGAARSSSPGSTSCCATRARAGAARHDRHRRGRARDRAVAHLRRHAQPQERQPRPDLPRARLRADRRRAPRQRRYHVVVVRSTVLPGTTHDRGHPRARAAIGQEVRRRLRRGGQPRVPARGNALHDFRHPPLTLVGHNHAADATGTTALYEVGRGAALQRRASAWPR
jgi:hypothetical protein